MKTFFTGDSLSPTMLDLNLCDFATIPNISVYLSCSETDFVHQPGNLVDKMIVTLTEASLSRSKVEVEGAGLCEAVRNSITR
jgi:hypothetical protein